MNVCLEGRREAQRLVLLRGLPTSLATPSLRQAPAARHAREAAGKKRGIGETASYISKFRSASAKALAIRPETDGWQSSRVMFWARNVSPSKNRSTSRAPLPPPAQVLLPVLQRFSDSQTRGLPGFRASRLLGFWASGLMDFRASRLPGFWVSGLRIFGPFQKGINPKSS
eukprot:scaffold2733_cov255-Pinguiococcus_pyrenoidosus.AAC.5